MASRLLTSLVLACALGVVGCSREDPESAVRATVDRFATATAERDVQTICDELLAEELLAELRGGGLPCELVFQNGYEALREPTLVVRGITVDGDRAAAEVRTDAANQPPSDDTVRLIRQGETWRIVALDSPGG